ncbi:MAG: hypothetical protein CTY15_04135 [Methylocystis sp.]|nr:MAG: hypothetical protein CTY15_04135 [Methylocystis sp.]
MRPNRQRPRRCSWKSATRCATGRPSLEGRAINPVAIPPRAQSRARDLASAEFINCALRPSSLGLALIAASAKGVCALLLGDDPEAIEADFRRRFPNATQIGPDERCARVFDAALALIDAPASAPVFSLDARGTAFQRRVWQALREIAPGQTASYADVARRIGAPKATRAVAAACAANPVAVAIPCHRVLKSDGSLSGYRWGVDRKRALLQREGVRVAV